MLKRLHNKMLCKIAMFILIAAFGITACTQDNENHVNGTGSNAGETEFAKIITITTPLGNPLARASTRIWAMNNDSMKVEWSDTLNENGQIHFHQELLGPHLLESHLGDSLSMMRWLDFGKGFSQTFKASASVTLKGRITNNDNAIKGATISILDKKTKTDDNGNFTIDGIPEGVHYAFIEGSFGKFNYQMQTGLNETGTTNNIDIADSVFTVIEDFENWEEKQTLIGKSFGDGKWFICTDSLQGGGSHSTSLFSKDLTITGAEAKNGTSMHAVFDLDESFDGHYGVTGFNIGGDFETHENAPAFYDLSGMKAISFDAKGKGKLFLQLTKRGKDGKKAFYKTSPISLNENWNHFTFTIEDFDTDMIAVNSINFMFEQDAELYLDNVRLDGISPAMWPTLSIE